jgi:two-component system response regulator PrrA
MFVRGTEEPAPTTVLVADDDADVRALVAAELRGEGYEVREAADGAELLWQLEEALGHPSAGPDIIVTDVMMPRLSGLGVLQALRQAGARVPVLVMTVLDEPSIQIVAKRLGARGVLRKPLDMTSLKITLQKLARSQ